MLARAAVTPPSTAVFFRFMGGDYVESHPKATAKYVIAGHLN